MPTLAAWIITFVGELLGQTALPLWIQHMVTGFLGRALTESVLEAAEGRLKAFTIAQMEAYQMSHPNTITSEIMADIEKFITLTPAALEGRASPFGTVKTTARAA